MAVIIKPRPNKTPTKPNKKKKYTTGDFSMPRYTGNHSGMTQALLLVFRVSLF